MLIADQDIGGARVRRVFTARGETKRPGTYLSADEVLAMPLGNRKALIDSGYLEVYPKSSPPPRSASRSIISSSRSATVSMTKSSAARSIQSR